MTTVSKIKLVLEDLVSAEIKDAEGSVTSASTHRASAIVRLLSICPEYNPSGEEEKIVESCIREMTLLGVLGNLLEPPED